VYSDHCQFHSPLAKQQPVRKTVTYLHVRAINACSTRGTLTIGAIWVPCALGRSGRKYLKREGDGASPVGIWRLEQGFFRADKILRPRSMLPFTHLKKGWGWCETVGDRNYNRRVSIPYATSHEELSRKDDLYDIVIETDHNKRPRVQGRGSAIFFHLVRDGYGPTAGCVALSFKDMRKILARCKGKAKLVIWPPDGVPSNVFRK
jgi:L,D-peptidoglycan transpeptidase YkuD (ErfK/YbiS/YcfS/YnhG family)